MDQVKPTYQTTDPETVAGHKFDLLSNRCVNTKTDLVAYPGGVCGVHRDTVHAAIRSDIGDQHPKFRYACIGALNDTEYNQILSDIIRRSEKAYDAIARGAGRK